MKQTVGILFGVAVSALCFWYSARNADWSEVKAGFATANYWTLPAILLLTFGFYWLKAQRWALLLRPVMPLSGRTLFAPVMIGFAANNLLPAHLGELVRVAVVRQQFRVPVAAGLSTVVLERLFDVLAILLLFAAGLAFTDGLAENYRYAAWLAGLVALGALFGAAVYLCWADALVRLLEAAARRAPWLPGALTAAVLNLLRQGADGLAALKNARAVALIAVNSLAQWAMNCMIAYLALAAFDIPVTVATGFVVTGVTAFAVMVPSTPGYFGVIQIAFLASLTAQGVTGMDSQILAASCYYQLSMYIPVTALGIFYLNQLGLKLSRLRRSAADRLAADP